MQRLRAIEQDWSTINDMRHDFESTKAKLRTLMHRELTPQSHSLPASSRVISEDLATDAYSPRCDTYGTATMYTPQHRLNLQAVDAALDRASGEVQNCRGMRDMSLASGSIADACSKPYSQWHKYEQHLRAREAETEAAELRSEVLFLSRRPLLLVLPCCKVDCVISLHWNCCTQMLHKQGNALQAWKPSEFMDELYEMIAWSGYSISCSVQK
jgi:hypothetical protein